MQGKTFRLVSWVVSYLTATALAIEAVWTKHQAATVWLGAGLLAVNALLTAVSVGSLSRDEYDFESYVFWEVCAGAMLLISSSVGAALGITTVVLLHQPAILWLGCCSLVATTAFSTAWAARVIAERRKTPMDADRSYYHR